MTNALVTDVVGGLAIMGAQLVLHYWYGKFVNSRFAILSLFPLRYIHKLNSVHSAFLLSLLFQKSFRVFALSKSNASMGNK